MNTNLVTVFVCAFLAQLGLCQSQISEKGTVLPNRTYYVTTIQTEPYMMLRTEAGLEGNDRYEGFCKDLLNVLTDYLGIKYEIRVVKDGKYGVLTPEGWNGMVGELIRKEADFAIADLTITSSRDKVIDFTQPFMMSGISIMVKKPDPQSLGTYVFLKPFSRQLWLYVAISYVLASLVLYLVERLASPAEREDANEVDGETKTRAEDVWHARLGASFWFVLTSAVRGAAADKQPKSAGARLVSISWWLFTVVLLAIYVAQLTVTLRASQAPSSNINSVEDLLNQRKIPFGPVVFGSTREFFRNTKVQKYHRVHQYLSENPDSFSASYKEAVARVRTGNYAFLMETTSNDYINLRAPCDTMRVGQLINDRGYGIATPLTSPLLNYYLNLALLHFQEDGTVEMLKKKWWQDRSECGPTADVTRNTGSDYQLQLATTSITGLFKMLLGMLVLGLLVAAIELCLRSKRDAERNKTTVYQALRTNVGAPSKHSKESGAASSPEAEKLELA